MTTYIRSFVAILLSMSCAVSSSAQTIGNISARPLGSAPVTLPSLGFFPGVGSSVLPSVSMPSLIPTLSAASPAPLLAKSVVPVASVAATPAFARAVSAAAPIKALGVEISKAAANNASAAPILNYYFDGTSAASEIPDAVTPAAPMSPEAFALEAQRRLATLKSLEAQRGARPEGAIPDDGEMQGRMEGIPSTNPERQKFMVELFKLGGATDADIVLQDAGRGRHNVIATIKGKTDRVIVVGAHYDKVSEGLGKIDNGTGATMIANLYQAMHGTQPEATIVFVAFAREEEGLIGSQVYVRSLDKAKRAKIDAMINLDTLAVNGTFSWKNNSTRAMLDRFAQVSRESGRALKEDILNGGDADSSTFRQAGIPAVTIYGASEDVIFDVIHSERDNMSAFNLGHYKNAYLLTLDAIKSLDRTPLGPVGRRDI